MIKHAGEQKDTIVFSYDADSGDSAGDLEKSAEELDDMIGFFTLDEEEN